LHLLWSLESLFLLITSVGQLVGCVCVFLVSASIFMPNRGALEVPNARYIL